MKHFRHPYLALLMALSALPALAAPTSKSDPADTAAAQKERAARAEFIERQKQLFEEKRIAVDAPVRESAPLIDLPQDEADAPNTVQP